MSPEFPTDGITLDGIRAFIDANGGRSAFTNMSTSEVNEMYIVPGTLLDKCSYCKQHGHDGSIKKATVFVSHAWSYMFLDVVAALDDWAAQHPGAVFWFDLFSNSQHDNDTKPFDWWRVCFRESVGKLGHTLLVLQWEDPLPLRRIWCVWEIVCTINTSSKLDIVMSRTEALALGAAFLNGVDITSRLCTVAVQHAEASVPSDKEAILDAIGDDGIYSCNTKVVAAVVDWISTSLAALLVQAAKEYDPASPQPSDEAHRRQLYSFTLWLIEFGKFEEAERMLHLFSIMRRRPCDAFDWDDHSDNPDHLFLPKSGLPSATPLSGDLSGARIEQDSQSREQLEAMEAADSIFERLELQEWRAKAALMEAQGNLGDAEYYCARLDVHGQKHLDTALEHLNAYSRVLWRRGKLEQAERLNRYLLEQFAEVDRQHPSSLELQTNHGHVLRAQGKLVEAEPWYREVFTTKSRTMGDDHLQTLTAMTHLANVLADMGRLEEAEPFYLKVLNSRRRLLSSGHPASLSSESNFAALLVQQGKLVQAEPILRRSLEHQRRVHGQEHVDTLSSLNNLACLFVAQGCMQEAEAEYRTAVDGFCRVVDPSHVEAQLVLRNLAGCLARQGKLEIRELLVLQAHTGILGKDHIAGFNALKTVIERLSAEGQVYVPQLLYRP